MKQNISIHFIEPGWLIASLTLAAASALAQTIVSGSISGTWDLRGSPYVLADNCTVPAGQSLRINPGVSVIMGAGMSLTASGNIQALGSASQRIQIAGVSPSAAYNTIKVLYSPTDSHFEFCDFRYAYVALWFEAVGTGTNFTPVVSSCTFSNITGAGVEAKSVGTVYNTLSGTGPLHSYLNPLIHNCVFSSCWKGCETWTYGTLFTAPYISIVGSGFASLHIENNLFYNITNCAVVFYSDSYAGVSTPLVANNNVIGCQYGVAAYDPNDATIKNNLFANDSHAVWRNGARSGTVGYNCFYQNGTNFDDYPSVYGQIIWQNRNGTPSDVVYNIFVDPLLAPGSLLQLQPSSACIDAGDPGGAYLDCCTNSLGTTVNDIGAYGGPQACGWLPSTNTTFSLTARLFVGVIINPTMPGRYRLEYCPNVGSPIWTQLTNVNLLSTPFTYIDFDYPAVNKRFYRAVLLP
jgi:hypothetical protein